MRILPIVLVGALALGLASCNEHKPRPVTDCGDRCIDAGEVADAGDTDKPDAADASDE